MGTSTPNKGPRNNTPLVPSFLDDEKTDDNKVNQNTSNDDKNKSKFDCGDENRFKTARTNFSKFVSSGGTNKNSLKRALGQYVRTSTGGSKNAATRMKSSKIVAGKLVSLLNQIKANGITQTLNMYNLAELANKPIYQILSNLVEIICLDHIKDGDIDQSIARDSAYKTLEEICSMVDNIENLDNFPIENILEIFISNSIKDRVINDIGINELAYSDKPEDIDFVEAQLTYFIKGAVEDVLPKHIKDGNLTDKDLNVIINSIYESSFEVLRILGEEDDQL